MKIFDENKNIKIKDRELRYKVVTYILAFMMIALVARLFQLTILQGTEYRNKSDNNRLKDIKVVAPRGNIYDKNGKLLAGVKATSTVRIFKDDFNRLQKEEKLETIDRLINLLNKDGASWDTDDYFISLNNFTFKEYSDYFTEIKSPKEKVLDIIIDNNLIEDILRKKNEKTNDKDGSFYNIKKVIRDLQFKGINIPTNAFEVETGEVSFLDNEEGKKYIAENKVDTDLYKHVAGLIKNDKSIIRKLLDQPFSRKLIWEVIEEKKLAGNIQLEKVVDVNRHGYIINKAELNKITSEITLDSSPKDDFYHLVKKATIDKLLTHVEENKKEGTKVIPAEYLLKILKEKGIDPQVKYELAKDDNDREFVQFSYENNEKSSVEPLTHLISIADKNELLDEFILSDDIKYIAQKVNTENNITPKILIDKDGKFEYSYDRNYNDIKNRYRIKGDFTGEELFTTLKDYYEVQDLDDYHSYSYLSIIRRLELQGDKAYIPINLSYGVSESCMSNIKEQFLNNRGIDVSMEPVRYYPNGNLASHILGYIGKISQSEEIEKYNEKTGHSPDSLIGKTGIEESQELSLKGTDGFKRVMVDNRGNRTETIKEQSAIPGKNVYLSLDLDLQKVAEKALENSIKSIRDKTENNSKWGKYTPRDQYPNANSGAVVVLDAKTGKVLALASYPSYDPNLFSTGISNSDWISLFPEDPRDFLAPRPLYNIATQSISQPGSTFKLATSLAALEKGMSPNEDINCQGVIDLGDTKFGCWIWNLHKRTHGPENLFTALRDSCNYYYYALALGKNPKNGVDTSVKVEVEDLIKTANDLGLGSRTGIEINVPRESKGVVPNPNTKKSVTKILLRQMLEQNIEKYILPDMQKDDYNFPEIIDTISSWIDSPELLNRQQVSDKLTELKLNAEKAIEGTKEPLTDIIKYTYLNQAKWDNSDALNAVIGQGQNSYTPIQMARFMAVFANGGYKVKASVIDKIISHDKKTISFENKPDPERINFNNYNNLKYVLDGMHRASKIPTNWEIFKDLPVSIGNKTGTAQKSGVNPVTGQPYDNYAWTVAFAPYDNPEIAIATVIFQGGSGTYCGPIIRDIVGQYIDSKGEDYKPEKTETNREDSQNSDLVGD